MRWWPGGRDELEDFEVAVVESDIHLRLAHSAVLEHQLGHEFSIQFRDAQDAWNLPAWHIAGNPLIKTLHPAEHAATSHSSSSFCPDATGASTDDGRSAKGGAC